MSHSCRKDVYRAGGRSKIQPRQEEGCQVGGGGGEREGDVPPPARSAEAFEVYCTSM